MSFSTYENSVESGSPVELYEISIGTDIYRLSSTEDDYTFGSDVYTGSAINRTNIGVGQDQRTQLINFELPSSHPFVQRYVLIAPGQRATISVFRFHRLDTPGLERVLTFKGIVRSVAFTRQGNAAQVACMPLTGGLSRQVPRFTYQAPCNHVLFDDRCKVALDLTTSYSGTVTAVSGSDVTVNGLSAKGSGWAVGGYITNTTNDDYRLILAQSGDTITLLLPFPADLAVLGQTFVVTAGCDHSIATCKSKFDNVANYGGFAFVPTKNPFETGL